MLFGVPAVPQRVGEPGVGDVRADGAAVFRVRFRTEFFYSAGRNRA